MPPLRRATIKNKGKVEGGDNENPPAIQFFLLKILSWTNLSITFKERKKWVPIIRIAHFPINRIYLWENEHLLLWAPPKKIFPPFKSDG